MDELVHLINPHKTTTGNVPGVPKLKVYERGSSLNIQLFYARQKFLTLEG